MFPPYGERGVGREEEKEKKKERRKKKDKEKEMRIVILDGFTANPGDLDWKRLESLGELTVYDRTAPSEVVARSEGADAVFTNKTPITAADIDRLPRLKFIGVLATGYNIVDIKAAKEHGVTVSNVPAYSTMSVAQNVFALLLDITNDVAHYTNEVKEGKWSRCEDFCFTDTCLTELAGKRMGIVGYGDIGSRVASIAAAFGMKVGAWTSKPQEAIGDVEKMDLDTLFAESDVVSLHCPLTDETYHIADTRRIGLMKKTAILINTGRGPLVDEEALADALRERRIAAAGLDVLAQEPPAADNPLLTAPNVRITPHISWATKEARVRLLDTAIGNLEAFMEGKPRNVVD